MRQDEAGHNRTQPQAGNATGRQARIHSQRPPIPLTGSVARLIVAGGGGGAGGTGSGFGSVCGISAITGNAGAGGGGGGGLLQQRSGASGRRPTCNSSGCFANNNGSGGGGGSSFVTAKAPLG